MKTIFVSGIHGVGKGTLCQEIKNRLNIESHSCSDLIKEYSNYIEKDKCVDNAEFNQLALLKGLQEITSPAILLDGHFCLLGKDFQVINLEFKTFESISPNKVLLVTCDELKVSDRIFNRDGKRIEVKALKELQQSEKYRAQEFCNKNNIPLYEFVSEKSELGSLIKWLTV
ncbi:ATP-binding protein [Vibrio tritonius]|uniref:ATP-binding protein n=1 Tax=Vibrio tritonius TaxID=1435069 RepID=UPI00315CF561